MNQMGAKPVAQDQGGRGCGIDWIQIREKDLSGKECAALTSAAIERAAYYQQAGRVGLALS